MVLADALTKAGRLVEMQRMFATRPNRGFSATEIARLLGIAPRTVRKYITEMSASSFPRPANVESGSRQRF